MTDRELLELAAKAAGFEIEPCTCKKVPFRHAKKTGKYGHWNPLNDDGEALRLAVTLGLSISCRYAAASAWNLLIEIEERYEADPYAATRRAIVRAAAEIGGTK